MAAKKFSHALFCAAFFVGTLFASEYYVSSVGNDDSVGTQSSPWKTIAKANSKTLVPGDKVFFKRGDTFFGSILVFNSGTTGSLITYGAYGTGNRPVISGAPLITGWQLVSGKYVATYNGDATIPVEQLFAGTAPLHIARFPNTGYIPIDTAISRTELTCSALAGSTDWTGAYVHIRSERWSLDARKIIDFNKTSGHITLDKAANYDINKSEGLFINGVLAAIDTEEWYYDSLNKKVYLTAAQIPQKLFGSTIPYGLLSSGQSFVTIDNLAFFGQTQANIRIDGGSSITISNCYARYSDGFGILLSANSSTIDGCVIAYANEGGLKLYGNANRIAHSTITNIGMMDRLNRFGLGGDCCTGRALDFGGSDNIISENNIDSIGYVGIGFGGPNNLIEKNLVQHICMTTDDGAAIYTWSPNFDSTGSAGTIIRKNIVGNAVGAPQGTGSTSNNSCQGIYMDDRTHHVRIDSNTVFNNYLGIFLHNNRYHTVTGNICYGNTGHQIQISRDAIVSQQVYGNQVYDNIFYSTSESQGTITQARSAQQDSNMVSLARNYTVVENPFSALCLKDGIPVWKKTFVNDTFATIGTNKISSGEFDQATLAWGCWPSQYFALSKDSLASPDKACLIVHYFGNPANGAPIFFTNTTYPLDSGHIYRLRFSAKANHAGSMNCFARMSGAPYTGSGLTRTITLDTIWKDYELFFEATLTNANSRVDFYPTKTDTLMWMDNVSLYEINSSQINTALKSKLFINTTSSSKTFPLGLPKWSDVVGNQNITGSISLQAYQGKILINDSIGTTPLRTPLRLVTSSRLIHSIQITKEGLSLLLSPSQTRTNISVIDMQGRLIKSCPVSAGDTEKRLAIHANNRWGSKVFIVVVSNKARSEIYKSITY